MVARQWGMQLMCNPITSMANIARKRLCLKKAPNRIDKTHTRFFLGERDGIARGMLGPFF